MAPCHLRKALLSLSRAMQRIILILVFLLAPVVAHGAEQRLTIRTAKGDLVFMIELAGTPQSRSTGLMHRRELAADAGMLFDFPKTGAVSMWMKDTLIPLDMLFIKPDGSIANIAERAVPGSLTPINSKGPVRGVLELNGGTSARMGISPGDKIIHPIFGNVE